MRPHHDTTVSDDLRETIRAFLEPELKPFGLKGLRIQAVVDHDDDTVLDIDADYEIEGPPVEIAKLAGLTTRLRSLLWNKGEERFPLIHHHIDDNRPLIES
ncbi:hypothetical protein M2352_000157 [Azospirillum fermentarium]|uniref:hypothetical protein n=1 Tax=Azospirillum fermentarium TaxID=1233114 RepID=UPI00222691DD|nr:hypothetical protein [Azospirillum fermentarium]MCW2244566.1 hypothetical protein [Azospirillum fermentarium]